MDKRLVVQLILEPNCELNAVDYSDYNSLGFDDAENHVMLDFLVYNEDKVPVHDSVNIRKSCLERGYYRNIFTSTYILRKDGIYSYYKMVIPTIDHFKDISGIVNELFYYDGCFYWCNKVSSVNSIEDALNGSTIITDFLELYQIVYQNNASQTFYLPTKKIFSICILNKCLALLQKKVIDNPHVCKNIDCDDTYTQHRDFLFGAIYVLDYLKDIGHFAEAQRIVDNLSSCDFVCNEFIDKNDCGCGKA